MRPRLVLLAVTAILVGFGLLMVYSSSSVTALAENGDAAYYLKRQAMMALLGLVAAGVIVHFDYHTWCRTLLTPIWVLTVILLALVFTPFAGGDAYGANRWITVAGFQLQPSEFAKLTIVLTGANVAQRYFEEGSITWHDFLMLMALGVGVPLVLIVAQPDKGSTMVLGLTLVVMGYLAGVPKRFLAFFLVLGLVGFVALSLKDDYSRQRLLTMLDPWKDPYKTGYQLIQGFYAFGSGGLLGVGVGFSRQKYSYLPMAHNDFIYAVIGEECGFVGALGLLVGFGVFAWAGLRIARHAPDLAGRLIAAGCTSLIVVQTLLNVAGVLGIFPLSGKPIPFISYGGTSITASIMIAGMIVSVSAHSRLPETAHDSARGSWQVEGGAREGSRAGAGLSFVGEPSPRSERPSGGRARLTVVDGGGGTGRGTRAPGGRQAPRTEGRRSGRAASRGPSGARGRGAAGGRQRIDLGPSASDRLRGRGRGSGNRR
ncbi:putative lipid II flippase FtsW [Olsenella sp. An290]|nr:putative lipid II flippase FtsW [Olsenella sp. An290]